MHFTWVIYRVYPLEQNPRIFKIHACLRGNRYLDIPQFEQNPCIFYVGTGILVSPHLSRIHTFLCGNRYLGTPSSNRIRAFLRGNRYLGTPPLEQNPCIFTREPVS